MYACICAFAWCVCVCVCVCARIDSRLADNLWCEGKYEFGIGSLHYIKTAIYIINIGFLIDDLVPFSVLSIGYI